MAIDWSTAAAYKASQKFLDEKHGRTPVSEEDRAKQVEAQRNYRARQIVRSSIRQRNHV